MILSRSRDVASCILEAAHVRHIVTIDHVTIDHVKQLVIMVIRAIILYQCTDL